MAKYNFIDNAKLPEEWVVWCDTEDKFEFVNSYLVHIKSACWFFAEGNAYFGTTWGRSKEDNGVPRSKIIDYDDFVRIVTSPEEKRKLRSWGCKPKTFSSFRELKKIVDELIKKDTTWIGDSIKDYYGIGKGNSELCSKYSSNFDEIITFEQLQSIYAGFPNWFYEDETPQVKIEIGMNGDVTGRGSFMGTGGDIPDLHTWKKEWSINPFGEETMQKTFEKEILKKFREQFNTINPFINLNSNQNGNTNNKKGNIIEVCRPSATVKLSERIRGNQVSGRTGRASATSGYSCYKTGGLKVD